MKPTNEAKKKNNFWDNMRARREKGLPPKKKGQKGYPTAKAWKKITGEGVESLRELIRETLAVGIRDLDPLSSGGWTSPEHEEWLASLEDEYAEIEGSDVHPDDGVKKVGETSGGADRPLSSIK
jgi:hypothetical protein